MIFICLILDFIANLKYSVLQLAFNLNSFRCSFQVNVSLASPICFRVFVFIILGNVISYDFLVTILMKSHLGMI